MHASRVGDPMSLLGHLSTSGSPVREFFVQRLPNTDLIVREAAPALRRGQQRPSLGAPPGVNAGRVGTAVDFLLRFALAPEPCSRHGPAHHGAGMVGRALSLAALDAVGEALAFVADLAPYRRVVTDTQWEELARMSLLLATFEAVYRSGLPPDAFAELTAPPSTWREWANLVCLEPEVEDVAVLGWAAAEDHSDLRGRNLRCNPVFVQSRALGGADADLITDDGCLIDFKSTSTTRTCSRTDIWQLCGYVLADTNDDYRIRQVALSALRWRNRVVWDLGELMCNLAGGRVQLAAMRRDFADLLSRLNAGRRTFSSRLTQSSGRSGAP